jgi:hypothetical protein
LGVFIGLSKLFLNTNNEKTITTRVHARDDNDNKTSEEITRKQEME